ncbi:MAG: DHHA1 domain-containing protein, partial [Longimicrobiales bacterium]|nr:DHHA1 domain-containing protein [Longimicrobiales bacterium]
WTASEFIYLKMGRPVQLNEPAGYPVLAADFPDGKSALFAFAADDVISRGVRADAVVRGVADRVGGRGGGRPHLAQAGLPDAERAEEALAGAVEVVRTLAAGSAS